MTNKIILVNINSEMFAFKTSMLTSKQKKYIEAIAECAYDDFEDLSEQSNYDICRWFVGQVKEAIGIELLTVGIECEFTIAK